MSEAFQSLFGEPESKYDAFSAYDLTLNDDPRGTIRKLFYDAIPPEKPYLYVTSAPSLQAWPAFEDSIEHKLLDFYLQLMLRYGLAIALTGCTKPQPDRNDISHQSKNRHILEDFLKKIQDNHLETATKFDGGRAHLALLADIEHVRRLLFELFPEEFCDIVAERRSVLPFLASVHLAGNMPHHEIANAIEGLLRDAALDEHFDAHLKFLRDLLKWGSSDYDDELNRLVGKGLGHTIPEKAIEINAVTWSVRAKSRMYKLGRDLSRWLLSGALRWASQKTGADPVRILIIDPELDPEYDQIAPSGRSQRMRMRDRIEMNLKTLFHLDISAFELHVIYAKEGILPAQDNTLGDSVVAFDRFLATQLVDRVRQVQMGDWLPPNPMPHVNADHSRFELWEYHPLVSKKEWSLWNYQVIFCEVGYDSIFAGPQIVQKLRSFFERTNRPGRTPEEKLSKAARGVPIHQLTLDDDTMPAIIVQTRNADADYIHQCLNLGAHSYVSKDRLFQIPARMYTAIIDEQNEALHRAKAYKAGVSKERLGLRTNFRNLYALGAERIAQLRNSDGPYLITGAEADRKWLRQLPKADLHRHLGTSIRLRTIEALAFNTVGHLVTRYSVPSEPDTYDKDTHLDDAIRHTLCALIVCAVFRDNDTGKIPLDRRLGNTAQLLLSATAWVDERLDLKSRTSRLDGAHSPREKKKDEYWKDTSPLETVVKYLAPVGSPIRLYQATGLVVAATRLLRIHAAESGDAASRGDKVSEAIKARWAYLEDLEKWREICEKLADAKAADASVARASTAPRGSEMLSASDIWIKHFIEPAARDCYEQGHAIQLPSQSAFRSVGYFRELHKQVIERVDRATKEMIVRLPAVEKEVAAMLRSDFGGDEKDWIDIIFKAIGAGGKLPSLAELVINRFHEETSDIVQSKASSKNVSRPSNSSFRKLGLERYLWGCGLLGADHLQFPENLVIAAKDLVEQCAEECVTYSEVRCETPGYTTAGMSATGATDLLLKSFDLASAYYRETGGKPAERRQLSNGLLDPTTQSSHGATFIRTNILLAAKRHKHREHCARVVSLLERYVSNGHRVLEFDCDPTIIPNWWKPCSVVGFDLSGNEAVDINEVKPIEEEVKRLFRYNSPITIHAGEAATAESIWNAVYNLHARRIGHGLRLRESPKLLQYCIDEGICMEMCPVSNVLTYGFHPVASEQAYRGLANEHYPLRYYMAAGLEVCLNTDNRGLHQPVNQKFDPESEGATITDDYLMAAKLSGGFSKWEILKLVRAGFKHAFLSKFDISELISAAENRVYTLVARPPGQDWRAAPWPGEFPSWPPELHVDQGD